MPIAKAVPVPAIPTCPSAVSTRAGSLTIDNVPLNDNESHQVYWVDHGDLLANAQDVQIQRGIGNSLYGASAFGGSVNVRTRIAADEESFSLKTGVGSFGTTKLSAVYQSGARFDKNFAMTVRFSRIASDGYREFHNSRQQSAFAGLEYRKSNWTHQLRANIGYENTNLVWDGVSSIDLNDRKARRQSYRGYTDDFLQQIYSLNSTWIPSDRTKFVNTIYLVSGSGYYEVNKRGVDWYSYGLDVQDQYPDSVELDLTTDLLRRKWIVNQYTGITPTITKMTGKSRLDAGLELRFYTGNHFGQVSRFSDPSLQDYFADGWYRYYQYRGEKITRTAFARLVYEPFEKLYLSADLQVQSHDWQLRQKRIGHAAGHRLDAVWNFVNPRFGVVAQLTPQLSLFANVGKAQKEPADNQIISADDVWSEPVMAAAESIWDYETGLSLNYSRVELNVNAYIIEYMNEQLKNINIDQEGEYSYYSADRTRHQGLELEAVLALSPALRISGNGTLNYDTFISGQNAGNYLPHFPRSLMNLKFIWNGANREFGCSWKYVGRQYLDDENNWDIAPWSTFDLYGQYRIDHFQFKIQINNLLDELYATNGYGYQWDGQSYVYYWPAATRSVYGSIEYEF